MLLASMCFSKDLKTRRLPLDQLRNRKGRAKETPTAEPTTFQQAATIAHKTPRNPQSVAGQTAIMSSLQRVVVSALLILTIAFAFFAQSAEATKGQYTSCSLVDMSN